MSNAPVIKRSLFAVAALALFAFLIWASDTITLQGERTIYTVNCEHGAWKDLRCTGKMVAGDRYRYRASTSRHEVIFWVAGLPKPSGRYTDCDVRNRGNWSCNATLDAAPSITREMTNDQATHGPAGLTISFHAVPKWKWWLLRVGLVTMNEAAY
jgi:hypothetical protein